MYRLPNAITILRIVLVPVFAIAFALPGDTWRLVAFVVFCIAGLSDALDGLAARKLNAGSDFGRMLDPIADKVLVAVGRAPRTEGIGLEQTKIEVERGFIHVNEAQETAEPGVYAVGDIVAGLPQLAHVGAMSGIVAVTKIAGKTYRPVRRDRIPGCTYTEPQIGSAGLTEAQAREKGYEVKVGKFPFAGNSKATIVGSHDGFVKIVADAKYGEILGVHIIGPQATELVAEAVAVMELEGTVDELMFTIHAHPTLGEAMLDAYAAVEGMAINA